MQEPWLLLSPAFRLWIAWNETSFHAAVTISLRTAMMASSFWTRGALPAAETYRMVSEKQAAALASFVSASAAAARQGRRVDPVKIASAALGPYRRSTRANVRRLSRHR
jgi:hypothetical protein